MMNKRELLLNLVAGVWVALILGMSFWLKGQPDLYSQELWAGLFVAMMALAWGSEKLLRKRLDLPAESDGQNLF